MNLFSSGKLNTFYKLTAKDFGLTKENKYPILLKIIEAKVN